MSDRTKIIMVFHKPLVHSGCGGQYAASAASWLRLFGPRSKDA